MYSAREISKNIYWVGGNDRRLEQFENLFPLENGISYNSYLFLDEKTAIIDTVDDDITDQYLENITKLMNGRDLDYLVINHMEPDHCGNIENLVRRYPNVKVVGNKKSFDLFKQFYNMDISKNEMLVAEGDELDLGEHKLKFIFAPMVHWPEVMMNVETTKGILFSADAFGVFGALTGNLFDDETDYRNLYLDEARRYYSNIVGKFGAQVQMVFKKLKDYDINMICSLHGPIFRTEKDLILSLYDKWSRYEPEEEGVVLFYGSMYGNTANAVDALANKLGERGVKNMRIFDVSKTHYSYIISEIFKYSHMVVAAPTYNMGLYHPMASVLDDMIALGLKNRKVALISNHSWASAADKIMREKFSKMKNMEILNDSFDINSRMKDHEEDKLDELADIIANSVLNPEKKENE